ncbi:MAG TPA: hypothetical protein VGP89_13730 [Candidatus Angelobacter sp.]|nr:hypothetical protein [Candidatus Angelobacter sp.]
MPAPEHDAQYGLLFVLVLGHSGVLHGPISLVGISLHIDRVCQQLNRGIAYEGF